MPDAIKYVVKCRCSGEIEEPIAYIDDDRSLGCASPEEHHV